MSKEKISESHSRWNLSIIAAALVYVGTLLLPLFFIPGLGIDVSKKFLLSFAVLLAAISWIAAVLRSGKLEFARLWLWPAAGLLLLSSLCAALFSGTIMHSLIGYGFEQDTVLSLVVLVFAMFLVGTVFATKDKILNFFLLLFAGGVLIFLAQALGFLVPAGWLPFGLFDSTAFNLIGKWNSFGIYFGFLALAALTFLELFSIRRVKVLHWLLVSVVAGGLVVVALVNFWTVWLVVGVLTALLYGYLLLFSESTERKYLRPSLVVLVVSVLFVILSQPGAPLGNLIAVAHRTLGISVIEVRPSLQGTVGVASKALAADPVFGAGPNNFPREWLRHKPLQVNETEFWNLTFDTGVGTIPSFAVTWGGVGILAWVIFLATFVYYGLRSMTALIRSKQNHSLVFLTLLGSLYFWIFSFVYAADTVILGFAFILTGLFAAALVESKQVSLKEIDLSAKSRLGLLVTSGLVALVVISLLSTILLAQIAGSVVYFQRGLAAGQAQDMERSERYLNKAVSLNNSEIYHRALVELYMVKMQSIANDKETPQDKLLGDFQSALNLAINNAKIAISLNDTNYVNWIYLGRIYESLVPIKVANSYAEAVGAYNKARELNPTSPDILLDFARLEVSNGDEVAAREYLEEALKLKSNFTTAILFLAQIEEGNGNMTEALKQASRAAELAPNDTATLFQAGLFYYRAGEYQTAATMLEKAISLDPLYSNARYFLGLSYDKLGEKSKAIEQFEQVAKYNASNQEVKTILENLNAGLPALPEAAPQETEDEKPSAANR